MTSWCCMLINIQNFNSPWCYTAAVSISVTAHWLPPGGSGQTSAVFGKEARWYWSYISPMLCINQVCSVKEHVFNCVPECQSCVGPPWAERGPRSHWNHRLQWKHSGGFTGQTSHHLTQLSFVWFGYLLMNNLIFFNWQTFSMQKLNTFEKSRGVGIQ